jgi:formylglycine-generating enzyme required for sulfatase activity
MTTPNELIAILERILHGSGDEKDIAVVQQYFEAVNNQNPVQLAKYIVNIPEGKDIHIGDRITNQGIDEETKAIVRQIQERLQQISIETSFPKNEQISLSSGFFPQITNENAVTTNSQKQLLPPPPIPTLKTFEFEVITVDAQSRETKRCFKQADYFAEYLNEGVVLEIVSLPGGKFQMGAAKDEEASQEQERPQHIVNIKPFFIGKYPITQAQWKIVANLPKIKRDLNPEPSCFNGNNLPVERVSWHQAQEFCERLSRETKRNYRLPSEAEWEYACRAKTSTPFYFGKTITTHLANYCGENEDINDIYRQQTTEVGTFPGNSFGLFDMHGLVWEWCTDYDHEDYHDAPSDGSVWLNDGNEEYRILRGGSWNSSPNLCRSASRFSENASVTDKEFGFRVVCS